MFPKTYFTLFYFPGHYFPPAQAPKVPGGTWAEADRGNGFTEPGRVASWVEEGRFNLWS